MRKLASIQKIKNIEPIEGADTIEKATVLGWQLVVKKGEFKVGDTCIYCETDSVMPDRPEFEFLRPRGMRIKTVRLRGQVSQGICFPVSMFLSNSDTLIEEGMDVTDILGIAKYDPPIPANLAGVAKGNFPSFIPKTDETRVQVLQAVLDKYKGTDCYIAEKLDGSSVTYYMKDGVFGVCSRNLDLLETEDNSLWKFARENDIENKLRGMSYNFALQGEIIGEGIQGNKYKIKGQTVKFFNGMYIDEFRYADVGELRMITQEFGLDMCPIINYAFKLNNDINELVQMSIGKSELNKDAWREGIVIRPLKETIDSQISDGYLHADRVSFKVINPEFLIEHGE